MTFIDELKIRFDAEILFPMRVWWLRNENVIKYTLFGCSVVMIGYFAYETHIYCCS